MRVQKLRFESIIICVLMAAALLAARNAGAGVERIDKFDLNAKLCAPNLVLLDVRTGEVWEKSKIKIKCSRRVDPYNVESWIDTIPKDRDIVLYCCS